MWQGRRSAGLAPIARISSKDYFRCVSSDELDDLAPMTDARTIRALAHPLRLRILDLLSERGSLTATQVGEEVNESPANCSFHLRTLARYGYVEDAGGGEGRNRPWKISDRTTYWTPVDADPVTVDAILVAQAAIDAAHQERIRTWRRRAPAAPRAWQENTFEMSYETWLTPEELRQVSAEISSAIRRVVDGRLKRPGQEARVLLHASGFPVGQQLPDVPEADRPKPDRSKSDRPKPEAHS